MGLTVAVIGLGLSAVGTIQSQKAQKKQARAQQESIRLQKRQDAIRASRSRIQSVREARVKRASIVAASGSQGLLGSSGAIGGAGSVQSQLGEQLGFQGQITELGGQINTQQQQASIFGSRAATGQAIAGVGSSIFGAAGGFKTIFSAGGGGSVPSTQSNFGGGRQGPV